MLPRGVAVTLWYALTRATFSLWHYLSQFSRVYKVSSCPPSSTMSSNNTNGYFGPVYTSPSKLPHPPIAAFKRRRIEGASVAADAVTGAAVWAGYIHDQNRPPTPHWQSANSLYPQVPNMQRHLPRAVEHSPSPYQLGLFPTPMYEPNYESSSAEGLMPQFYGSANLAGERQQRIRPVAGSQALSARPTRPLPNSTVKENSMAPHSLGAGNHMLWPTSSALAATASKISGKRKTVNYTSHFSDLELMNGVRRPTHYSYGRYPALAVQVDSYTSMAGLPNLPAAAPPASTHDLSSERPSPATEDGGFVQQTIATNPQPLSPPEGLPIGAWIPVSEDSSYLPSGSGAPTTADARGRSPEDYTTPSGTSSAHDERLAERGHLEREDESPATLVVPDARSISKASGKRKASEHEQELSQTVDDPLQFLDETQDYDFEGLAAVYWAGIFPDYADLTWSNESGFNGVPALHTPPAPPPELVASEHASITVQAPSLDESAPFPPSSVVNEAEDSQPPVTHVGNRALEGLPSSSLASTRLDGADLGSASSRSAPTGSSSEGSSAAAPEGETQSNQSSSATADALYECGLDGCTKMLDGKALTLKRHLSVHYSRVNSEGEKETPSQKERVLCKYPRCTRDEPLQFGNLVKHVRHTHWKVGQTTCDKCWGTYERRSAYEPERHWRVCPANPANTKDEAPPVSRPSTKSKRAKRHVACQVQ